MRGAILGRLDVVAAVDGHAGQTREVARERGQHSRPSPQRDLRQPLVERDRNTGFTASVS